MRPEQLVVVTGTGTEIGKTWVGAALSVAAREQGWTVSARKPVQSFDPADAGPTDAEALAAATGEHPDQVCLPTRSYPLAVAPPLAAATLDRGPLLLDDLVAELDWPETAVRLGLVEGAGGLRSPLADDGDSRELAARLSPDVVVLVADAGLGTVHSVRSALDGYEDELRLGGVPVVVVLNRFDPTDQIHDWNRSWLSGRDGLEVVVSTDELLESLAQHHG